MSEKVPRPVQDAPPETLVASSALRIALRGWAWGFGLGMGIGLLAALNSFETWDVTNLDALFSAWRVKSAFYLGLVIPFSMTSCVMSQRPNALGLDALGLYLAATVPLTPLCWLLDLTRDTILLSSLAVSGGAFLMFFSLYADAAGFPSSAFAPQKIVGTRASRRLAGMDILYVAGYLGCLALLLFWGLIAHFLLASDPGSGFFAVFDKASGLVVMFSFSFTPNFGSILYRTYPDERFWRLLLAFCVLVMPVGALLFTHDWNFLTSSRTLAMVYVPLSLFIFTMACLGRPRRTEPAGEDSDEPRA